MGYYAIGNYKIFYSSDRFADIEEPFLATLSAHERISLNILGMDLKPGKSRRDLDNLLIKTLETDLKELPRDVFEIKWVELSLKGKEASFNSWDIIYDYFHIHENGKIKDQRDFSEKIADDYAGIATIYPQGKIVELRFSVNPLRESSWSKLFGRRIELIKEVNLEMVNSIEGTLTNLQIDTPSETLYLGDTIRFVSKAK